MRKCAMQILVIVHLLHWHIGKEAVKFRAIDWCHLHRLNCEQLQRLLHRSCALNLEMYLVEGVIELVVSGRLVIQQEAD